MANQHYSSLPPRPERGQVRRARRQLDRAYLLVSLLLSVALVSIVFIGAAEAASAVFQFQLAWIFNDGKTGQVTEKVTQDSPLQAPQSADQPRYERSVAKLLNQARADRKLSAVTLDSSLADIARRYSAAMAERGFFGSIDPNGVAPSTRLQNARYQDADSVLEAVGAGYQSPERFVSALLDNPKTASIVLAKDADLIGVGYAFVKKDLRGPFYHYWTIDLVKRAESNQVLNFSVSINRGAEQTTSRQVQLTLNAGKFAQEMMVSNSPDFAGAQFQPYSDSVAWTLPARPGVNKVYVRVKTQDGRMVDSIASVSLTTKGVSNLALLSHGPVDVFKSPVRARTRTFAAAPLSSGLSANVSPSSDQTSEFMVGKVAVGIVMPQCSGGHDACSETWTATMMDQTVAKVQSAMNWWGARSGNNVTFVYDQRRAVATTYEPINHPQSDEGLWIGETLTNMGFAPAVGQGYFEQTYAYDNWMRSNYKADWAFTIFVANSLNDADGQFSNGYFAYTYGLGPFMVGTYDNANYGIAQMDAVVAHETGHMFGAQDEYPGANAACTNSSGYLIVQNQNSQQTGCTMNVDSIMRGGYTPFANRAVDSYALGQMGMRDLDNNGRPDVIDTTPTVVLDTLPTGTLSAVTITGTAQDQPYVPPSTYPQPGPPPISVNNIVAVNYRVDGGAWQSASPRDSAFDTTTEGFTFTPALTNGVHTIEVQAANRVNNSSLVKTASVTISGSSVTPTLAATNTPPPSATATTTRTSTPTATRTVAATNTATASPTNSSTMQPTNTSTALPTNTPTPLPTNTATLQQTNTPTNTSTALPTSAATQTAVASPTASTNAMQLASGWNLLAVPAGSTYNAQSLASEINSQGGSVKEIDRWSVGTWQAYLVGYPFNNFTADSQLGFFVRTTAASQWSSVLAGTAGTRVLNTGWNLLAAPPCASGLTSCYTASTLAASMNAQGATVTEIDDWSNGAWTAYIVSYPFNNFAIKTGHAYFIKSGAAATWTP